MSELSLPPEISDLVTALTDAEVERLLPPGRKPDIHENAVHIICECYGTSEPDVGQTIDVDASLFRFKVLTARPDIVVVRDLRYRGHLFHVRDLAALIAAAKAHNRRVAEAAVARVFAALLAGPPEDVVEYDVLEEGLKHIYPPQNEWSLVITIGGNHVYVFPLDLPFVADNIVYVTRDSKTYRTEDDCYVDVIAHDHVPVDAEERAPRALTLDQLQAGETP